MVVGGRRGCDPREEGTDHIIAKEIRGWVRGGSEEFTGNLGSLFRADGSKDTQTLLGVRVRSGR